MFHRIVTLLVIAALVCAGCEGKGGITANHQPSLYFPPHLSGPQQATLVRVSDTDGDDVNVSVDVPAGFVVDKPTQVVKGGNGEIEFYWERRGEDINPVFDTVFTATDGRHNQPVTNARQISWPIAKSPPPSILADYSADLCDGTARLRMQIDGHRDQPWTVSVAAPDGFTADTATQVLAPWVNACEFTFHCATPNLGGSGEVTINLLDGADLLDEETAQLDVQPLGSNTPPEITGIAWENTTQGEGILHVTTTDADGEALWLHVTTPPGLRVTDDIANLDPGGGTADFIFSSINKTGGALGNVEIAVLDDRRGAAFATQDIRIEPGVYAPPEIEHVYWMDLGDGTGWLYIYALDPAYLPSTISIAPVPGFSLQPLTLSGSRYLFTANDKTITTTGEAAITVSSSSGQVVQTIPISLAPAAT